MLMGKSTIVILMSIKLVFLLFWIPKALKQRHRVAENPGSEMAQLFCSLPHPLLRFCFQYCGMRPIVSVVLWICLCLVFFENWNILNRSTHFFNNNIAVLIHLVFFKQMFFSKLKSWAGCLHQFLTKKCVRNLTEGLNHTQSHKRILKKCINRVLHTEYDKWMLI